MCLFACVDNEAGHVDMQPGGLLVVCCWESTRMHVCANVCVCSCLWLVICAQVHAQFPAWRREEDAPQGRRPTLVEQQGQGALSRGEEDVGCGGPVGGGGGAAAAGVGGGQMRSPPATETGSG